VTLLSVSNLRVVFGSERGDLAAVDDVGFDVAEGRCSASSANPVAGRA